MSCEFKNKFCSKKAQERTRRRKRKRQLQPAHTHSTQHTHRKKKSKEITYISYYVMALTHISIFAVLVLLISGRLTEALSPKLLNLSALRRIFDSEVENEYISDAILHQAAIHEWDRQADAYERRLAPEADWDSLKFPVIVCDASESLDAFSRKLRITQELRLEQQEKLRVVSNQPDLTCFQATTDFSVASRLSEDIFLHPYTHALKIGHHAVADVSYSVTLCFSECLCRRHTTHTHTLTHTLSHTHTHTTRALTTTVFYFSRPWVKDHQGPRRVSECVHPRLVSR